MCYNACHTSQEDHFNQCDKINVGVSGESSCFESFHARMKSTEFISSVEGGDHNTPFPFLA